MERDLDPDFLFTALQKHDHLPSVDEVKGLLTDAELALLEKRKNLTDDLILTGWYLFAIASSKSALEKYGYERRKAAYSVAGHIFDLVLQSFSLSKFESLKYCFASEISYLRSGLDPNAIAVFRREFPYGLIHDDNEPQYISALKLGTAFLGFDIRYVFQTTRQIINKQDLLIKELIDFNIYLSPYATFAGVVHGLRDLTSFLVYGRKDLLSRAYDSLISAVNNEISFSDRIEKWIAANILGIVDDLGNSSIWSIFPSTNSSTIQKAFTMGSPRVLTLWPPQKDLVNTINTNGFNLLSPNTKRMFISTPTSSGKTLLAQILVADHLTHNSTSVCFVAPTRSLCSEISRSLDLRLRYLNKKISTNMPEGDWLNFLIEDELMNEVEVMTPERLSYLVHKDRQKLLQKFGMFIFDEVHMLNDENRGWTLEEDLTFLHNVTCGFHHKLVLISAGIGNRNHFIQWMTTGENTPLSFHSDWRGPRRVSAVWRIEPDWKNGTEEKSRIKEVISRKNFPQKGYLDIRVSHSGEFRTISFPEIIGNIVIDEYETGKMKKVDRLSSANYKMICPLIQYLSDLGPIMVIETTKSNASRLALSLYDDNSIEENDNNQHIINLIKLRMGANHPLCRVLKKGIAYHHGSLPAEIRSLIEDGIADGSIRIVIATTSLTEGVNFPVKTVIIANQGVYSSEGYKKFITGSKLLNAIGRAGRAAKETEGIVVLAGQINTQPSDFQSLRPCDSDLQVLSTLASEKALEDLATFENLERVYQDAIIQINSGKVSDFIKFIWFLASEKEEATNIPSKDEILYVLTFSLAWQQLDIKEKERWEKIIDSTLRVYIKTPKQKRKKWSVSGSSINSSIVIDNIAREISEELAETKHTIDSETIIKMILGQSRIDRILSLPDVPKRKNFSTRNNSSGSPLVIPIELLMLDWINGSSLIEISSKYFSSVSDVDFRFEQVNNFIYDYFEVFLPKIFGIIIEWINEYLVEMHQDLIISKTIPSYIRWGVNNDDAILLMINGIKSRTLALKISREWLMLKSTGNIYDWIRNMDFEEWRQKFSPSNSELRNLLEYSRIKENNLLSKLFENNQIEFKVKSLFSNFPRTVCFLKETGEDEIGLIEIKVNGETVALINSYDHIDIENILQIGLDTTCFFFTKDSEGYLSIFLNKQEE